MTFSPMKMSDSFTKPPFSYPFHHVGFSPLLSPGPYSLHTLHLYLGFKEESIVGPILRTFNLSYLCFAWKPKASPKANTL